MSTEDKTGERSSPSDKSGQPQSEARRSRPPGARRPRRRNSRSGNKSKETESGNVGESRQVEEQSLGPGRKKRIFKRRKPEGESPAGESERSPQDADNNRKTRRSRSGNRTRSRSGASDNGDSGENRGPSRSRGRSDSSRSDSSHSRSRNDDRSHKRNNSHSRNTSARDVTADLSVTPDREAPDGIFSEDSYSDFDVRSGSRSAEAFPEVVETGEENFFSSEKGQDFASMEAAEIDFLKPHEADEDEMYADMPELDGSVIPKGHLMDVVGVKTHRSGTIDPFDCEDLILQKGDEVIVETERGLAIGEVMVPTTRRYVSREVPRVFRAATKNDMRQRERNLQKAAEAFDLCQKSIVQLKLVMKLVEVMYLHGGNKAVFYFMAEGRVDFRQLVKELAKDLHIRVEMRQIGVRDASRMIGGIGTCGQVLCCSRYIREFAPVSIRMAKDQDLVLNPEKVSGQCGRLMCCLAYEEEVYKEKGKKMPRVGKVVETPEGCGRVRDRDILRGLVRVELETEHGLKTYEITDIRPLKNNNNNTTNNNTYTTNSSNHDNHRGRSLRNESDNGAESNPRNRSGDSAPTDKVDGQSDDRHSDAETDSETSNDK